MTDWAGGAGNSVGAEDGDMLCDHQNRKSNYMSRGDCEEEMFPNVRITADGDENKNKRKKSADDANRWGKRPFTSQRVLASVAGPGRRAGNQCICEYQTY